MIINGWVSFAQRMDGHPGKTYTQQNSGEWLTCHSVVGDLPNHAIPPRFLSDERKPDGSFTDWAAASVQFILYKDGHLIQLYPVTASTWTSGGKEANTRSWSVEAEGGGPGGSSLAMPLDSEEISSLMTRELAVLREDGATFSARTAGVPIPFSLFTEPLTPAASMTFARLVREWEEHNGRAVEPGDLRQHKDVAAEFGYAPTACASNRYAGAWAHALEEEDDMALQEQVNTLALKTARLERIIAGNGLTTGLKGEDAMAFLDGDGASLALGQGMLQAHNHGGGGTSGPLYPATVANQRARLAAFGPTPVGGLMAAAFVESRAAYWLKEVGWAVGISIAVFILTAALNVSEETDWETWGIALAVGCVRIAAAAALDVLRRAILSKPVQAILRR